MEAPKYPSPRLRDHDGPRIRTTTHNCLADILWEIEIDPAGFSTSSQMARRWFGGLSTVRLACMILENLTWNCLFNLVRINYCYYYPAEVLEERWWRHKLRAAPTLFPELYYKSKDKPLKYWNSFTRCLEYKYGGWNMQLEPVTFWTTW